MQTLIELIDSFAGLGEAPAVADWEPMLAASPAFQKITLRKVNAPTAKALLQPASWPRDLRWVLDTFLMSQEGVQDGYDTPRFFLLQNGSVTASTAGNSASPLLTRSCPAGRTLACSPAALV